jgi:hypothetical protein
MPPISANDISMTNSRKSRMNPRGVLLLLLSVVAPCALTAILTPAAQQKVEPQELLAQAGEVLRQMSQITGLPIKGPLKKQVISRPEIEKYLIQNLHEEMTPAEIHAQEALVRALGLAPREFSLEKLMISFFTEQAAGFYDPKRKTMFIADWIPAQMQNMALAHELTHALQDQNWDLDGFMHATRDHDDATAARQAVVEGYATAAMFQQSAGGAELAELPALAPLIEKLVPQQLEEFPAFSSAPYFFRVQALFPYVQGVGIIQAGLQRGGWKDLAVLFEHPPETTRQIFDPQAYFDRQPPAALNLAHPPALEGVASLRFLREDALGELGYYSLLGQLISQEEAKSVGEAWLADRYLLYETSNNFALLARTRWTSAETAQAFFHDYHSILAHKYPELAMDKRSTADEFIGTASNGAIFLLHKGDECRWAEGIPAPKADALLAWLRAL